MEHVLRTPARVVGALALFVLPLNAAAQGAPASSPVTLTAGEELRVTYVSGDSGLLNPTHRRTVHVEFVAIDGGRLLVREGGELLVIDRTLLQSVSRRIGTKPASAPAIALGSAIGFATAFAVGAATHDESRSTSSPANSGLAAGVLIGAPIGALTAWLISRSRPIYENVEVRGTRPVVVRTLSGGVGLGMAVPLP